MTTPSLLARAEHKCEICGSADDLAGIKVSDQLGSDDACNLLCCSICTAQISGTGELDVSHLRALNDSMWNQEPAVQITAWRLLKRLSGNETWARDALDMLYLEPEILAIAEASSAEEAEDAAIKHVDSNGNILSAGDTVVLIKDLNVKGASFTAKRGTSVRRISLVMDNPEHIEGRVNDQQIVILTKFVKKA